MGAGEGRGKGGARDDWAPGRRGWPAHACPLAPAQSRRQSVLRTLPVQPTPPQLAVHALQLPYERRRVAQRGLRQGRGAARDMAHAGSPGANAAPEAAAPGELGFARLRDGGGWLADAPISSLRRSPRWLLAPQCRHRLARAAGLAGVRQRHAGAGSREALPASCAGAGPAVAPPAWRGRTPTWRPWTRTPRLRDADGERPSSWRRVSTTRPWQRARAAGRCQRAQWLAQWRCPAGHRALWLAATRA